MKNKGNTVPAVKFNPPTEYECFMDGKPAGTCFVYDPASWRNKNMPKTEIVTGEVSPK
jgi:hypothetical protein